MFSPIPIFTARKRRETLIVVHASATPTSAYESLVTPLRADRDVLVPHRLGCDEAKRWPAGSPASLQAEARHLLPLIDAQPQGVHVFGHSFGGAVALQLALERPERIASLTLFEPCRFGLLLGSDPTPAGLEILRAGRDVGMQVLSGAHASAARWFVDYWSGRGSWERMTAQQQDWIATQMPKVQAEFEAAFADRVPASRYAELEMPIHFIVGGVSPRPVHRITEMIAAAVGHATIARLPAAGHLAPVTDPERVRSALPARLAAETAVPLAA